MAVNGDVAALPCGTRPQTLVAQVFEAEPPSAAQGAHQATCPHCQASLASLRALQHDAEAMAAEPVEVPPDFARRVMARVRGATSGIRVSTEPLGSTTVNEELVARIARLAAMEVPYVTFALAGVEARPTGDALALSVRIVVAYGVGLHAVAAAVRERVGRELRRTAGVAVAKVDVLVDALSG